MTAEVVELTGQIRGVNVRWADVIVAGHTVEQVLSFDIAEAEYGRPFDDEMDRHIQLGMFAMDRISAEELFIKSRPPPAMSSTASAFGLQKGSSLVPSSVPAPQHLSSAGPARTPILAVTRRPRRIPRTLSL